MNKKERNDKDRFSITIVGVVIYSLILIGVMCGSYIGVKVILKNADIISQAQNQKDEEEDIAEEIEDDTYEEDTSKPQPTEEENLKFDVSHEMEIEDIVDPNSGYIDYSKVLFKPQKRDNTLTWNDCVFSQIENVSEPSQAKVNTFKIKSIPAVLSDLNNVVYRVYTNPANDQIEKITEVVDKENYVEVVDYYYDKGNLNYAAQYSMIIEKPIALSSAQITSRYYFRNDVMVRYIYCGDGKATEYRVADLKTYSDGTIDQYDFLEKDIINRAYIVYNFASKSEESQLIYGYVLDEFSIPLEDAEVIVTDKEDNVIASTATDGDGFYKLSVKCFEGANYTVTAKKETLVESSVYEVIAEEGSQKYAVAPIYLSYENNGAVYNVSIMARDALDTTKALAGGNIKLRRGIDNRDGEVIAAGVLDDTGAVLVPMTAGCYTAEVAKGGYETTYFPVIVRVDHLYAVGFAVPDVPQDTYVAVLTWETTPLDLDFKVLSYNQERVIKSSIDSIGSTTAEVVTIDNAGSDTFRLYVSDYGSIIAKDALSYNLTSSNAVVTVYNSDGQIGNMHVPVASAGVVWEPLQIFGGRVIGMNNYYYSIEDDVLWTTK